MRSSHLLSCLFAVGSFLAACAATSDGATSDENDLVDPANSNIRSPELGRITELKLLPNTNVPRAAFVQLADEKFVADLYDHIIAINESEHLTGADGYNQAINLIVAAESAPYQHLLGVIRQRHGIAAGAPVPLINPIAGVSNQDRWMQDFGELAAVRGENDPNHVWYGVLDANRQRGIDVAALGRILGISITKIPTPQSKGTYGGNTEATAEGTLYIGDKAPTQFLSGLKNLGNQNAISVPSDWLMVGHVDEYLTVVPAHNRCNAAFMVASGLEALNMARKAPEKFRVVGDVLATDDIAAAMDSYARNRRGISETYSLADFDLTRQPSNRAQEFVRLNVMAEDKAATAMRLLGGGACGEFIRLPQFFTEDNTGKAIALNPGTVNSLVLRNHAIVPDPNQDDLRAVVAQRYAQALGSEANVHFIDDAAYHTADGEVHCGTNVIRELSMPYRF